MQLRAGVIRARRRYLLSGIGSRSPAPTEGKVRLKVARMRVKQAGQVVLVAVKSAGKGGGYQRCVTAFSRHVQRLQVGQT
jgi:hypothetical protein